VSDILLYNGIDNGLSGTGREIDGIFEENFRSGNI
jgi:hypothetical protein